MRMDAMMRKLRRCAASCSALALRCAQRLLTTKQVILPMPTLAPGYISAVTHPVQAGTVHNSSCPSHASCENKCASPPPLTASKLAPICTATNPGTAVCIGIATGMSRECNESCTACIWDHHGNTTKRANAATPPATNGRTPCHTSSYEWANSIRTPQLRMGEQVHAERRPLHNFPRPIIRGCKMS